MPKPRTAGHIRKLGKALERERMAGFTRTRDQLDAIYGNLTSFIGKRGARLTRSNERTVSKMAAHLGRMRLAERRTSRAEQDLVGRYGGAMAGVAADATRPAEVAAENNVKTAKIGRNVGRYGAQTGQQLVSIAREGAETAQAGAEYATAQALAGRTKEDVAMVAQMQHDIYLAKLQHRQQMEQMEQQFTLQQAAEDKAREDAEQSIEPLAWSTGAPMLDVATAGAAGIRAYLEQNPEATWDETKAHLVDRGYMEADDPNAEAIVGQLFTSIKQRGLYGEGSDRTKMVNATREALFSVLAQAYGGMPEFISLLQNPAFRKKVEKYVNARLKKIYTEDILGLNSGGDESAGGVGVAPNMLRAGRGGPGGMT
jgi:hypothetical protein